MDTEDTMQTRTPAAEKLLENSVPPLSLPPRRRISMKIIVLVAVVMIIVVLGFLFRGSFIAATVNGSPISRMALVKGLEKSYGKKILDSLIAEKLIQNGLDEEGVVATDEEIDANIKLIEDRVGAQGMTIEEALAAEGATLAQFREQVTLQTRIENKFKDDIAVSDEEVKKYIKENKIAIPKGEGEDVKLKEAIRSQLRLEKLSAAMQVWMGELQAGASIKYLRKY